MYSIVQCLVKWVYSRKHTFTCNKSFNVHVSNSCFQSSVKTHMTNKMFTKAKANKKIIISNKKIIISNKKIIISNKKIEEINM